MIAKTADEFQSNWTQRLSYVMMAFRKPVHGSKVYTPQFLVIAEKINLPIVIQYHSPEQPSKTDVH